MRIALTLAVVLAAFAHAHAADRPEPLVDQPVPTLKLSATLGWRLSGVASMDIEHGIPVLVVGGDVYNTASQDRPSPTLRFGLRDADGNEFYHWTAELEQKQVKPGDYAPFEVRLAKPPSNTRVVEIATINSD